MGGPGSRWAAFALGAASALSALAVWALVPWRGPDVLGRWLARRIEREQWRQRLQRMPRRIVLVRHGQSMGNVDTLVYTHTPDNKIPLTDLGRDQARQAGRRLREIVGDGTVLFYVSPFLRTRQTFYEIYKSFVPSQTRIREDARIREQSWGNLQDSADQKRIRDERERVGIFFYRFPAGESGADVNDRCSSFLESLHREFDSEGCAQNVVLVTHGLFARLFLFRYFRWSVDEFERVRNLGNCGFYQLELQEEGPSAGVYKLVTPLEYRTPRSPKVPVLPKRGVGANIEDHLDHTHLEVSPRTSRRRGSVKSPSSPSPTAIAMGSGTGSARVPGGGRL